MAFISEKPFSFFLIPGLLTVIIIKRDQYPCGNDCFIDQFVHPSDHALISL